MPGESEDEIIELFESYRDRLFRFCANRLYCRNFADEAVSEVFLLLVEKHPQLRQKGPAGIRNWLYGAARNAVARQRRDATRRREIAEALVMRGTSASDLPDAANSPGAVLRAAVEEAMGRLRPTDREIVTFRYFDEMGIPEIAEILGLRAGTARTRLCRAVKRLRKELGEMWNHG